MIAHFLATFGVLLALLAGLAAAALAWCAGLYVPMARLEARGDCWYVAYAFGYVAATVAAVGAAVGTWG